MNFFENYLLHTACNNLDFDSIVSLVSEGYDVNRLNILGETPLMCVISHSYDNSEAATYCVSLLLLSGANPNLFGIGNLTPLMIAILQENLAIQKLLLDAGADVNIRYLPSISLLIPYGSTALSIALICNADFTSIYLLLDKLHQPDILMESLQRCNKSQEDQITSYILQRLGIA